jgi:hypothetical protein
MHPHVRNREIAGRMGLRNRQSLQGPRHAPKEGALPLLAFALQRRWRQYADAGALTKANYNRVGCRRTARSRSRRKQRSQAATFPKFSEIGVSKTAIPFCRAVWLLGDN